tara:strand:- start:143 stop:460 length:318 start_codon:yes stop_codon:yes gene_type:complete
MLKNNNILRNMTKAELVSKISEVTGIEKLTALAVLESCMEEIKTSVANNESVFLRGFGTFKPKKRAKKTGRNIKKNTAIIIPEHYIPSFKPSKVFTSKVKEKIKS